MLQNRFLFFLTTFVFLTTWEIWLPFFKDRSWRRPRWWTNLGIVGIDVLVGNLLAGLCLYHIMQVGQNWNFGLLRMLPIHPLGLTCIGIILLDFSIYLQHVLSHRIPILWRIHRVHHTDLFLDVTSALRFHPFEIVFSFAYKMVIVLALGIGAETLLIFEVILNSSAMFNHSNIYLPKKLDTFLRFFLVTPAMHRIHHRILPEETDSNYGFCLSFWDRLMGSYLSHSRYEDQVEGFGTPTHNPSHDLNLWELLIWPFKP